MNKQPIASALLSKVISIPLDEINITDQRFQTRFPTHLTKKKRRQAQEESEQHVKELADELEMITERHADDPRKAHLKPIVVWKPEGSSQYIIVSGFHRTAAYRLFNARKSKAKQHKQRKRSIVAQVFSGTEAAALIYSANRDIQPHRSKTQDAKKNAAWHMIYTGAAQAEDLTNQQIADNNGVGLSVVRRMKTVLNKVRSEGEDSIEHHPDWKTQWMIATKGLGGKTSEEWEYEQMINDTAKRFLSETFERTLGGDTAMLKDLMKAILKNAAEKRINLATDAELEGLLEINEQDRQHSVLREEASRQLQAELEEEQILFEARGEEIIEDF